MEVFMQTCIVCLKSLDTERIKNILFASCKLSIHGIHEGEKKADGKSEQITVKKAQILEAGKYLTYEEEQKTELSHWFFLNVTASEL